MTPEELVLLHGNAPYDPVKAHEYYLKTRQLKGRTKGVSAASASKTVRTAVMPPKKTAAQRRKEAEAKVAKLKSRLEALQKIVAELTRQAKARSGVSSSQATKDTATEPKKKLTTKQKADAAKRSKEYYEKHKSPSQQAKELEAKIKTLEKRIKDLKAKLKKK